MFGISLAELRRFVDIRLRRHRSQGRYRIGHDAGPDTAMGELAVTRWVKTHPRPWGVLFRVQTQRAVGRLTTAQRVERTAMKLLFTRIRRDPARWRDCDNARNVVSPGTMPRCAVDANLGSQPRDRATSYPKSSGATDSRCGAPAFSTCCERRICPELGAC